MASLHNSMWSKTKMYIKTYTVGPRRYIETSRWIIKLPALTKLLSGLDANMKEYTINRWGREFMEFLCPVRWSIGFGLVIVMPNVGQSRNYRDKCQWQSMVASHRNSILRHFTLDLVNLSKLTVGYYQGKPVAVDYDWM